MHVSKRGRDVVVASLSDKRVYEVKQLSSPALRRKEGDHTRLSATDDHAHPTAGGGTGKAGESGAEVPPTHQRLQVERRGECPEALLGFDCSRAGPQQ